MRAFLASIACLTHAAKLPDTCMLKDLSGNEIRIKSNGELIGEVPQKVKTAAEAAMTNNAAAIGGFSSLTYTGKTYVDREKPTKAHPFKWEIRYTDNNNTKWEVDLYEAATPQVQAIEKSITLTDLPADVLKKAKDQYPSLDASQCYLQLSYELSLVNSVTGKLETLSRMRNFEFDECPNTNTFSGLMDLEVVDTYDWATKSYAVKSASTVNVDIYDTTNPKLTGGDYPKLKDIEGNDVVLLSNGQVSSTLPSRVTAFAAGELATHKSTVGLVAPFTFTGKAFVDTERPTKLYPFKWELKYTDANNTAVEVDIYEGQTLKLQALEKSIKYSEIDAAVLTEVQNAVNSNSAGTVDVTKCVYQMSYEFTYVDGTTGVLNNHAANKRNLELDECDHTTAFLGLQDLEVLDLQKAAPHTVLFDLYDTTNPKAKGTSCHTTNPGTPCQIIAAADTHDLGVCALVLVFLASSCFF